MKDATIAHLRTPDWVHPKTTHMARWQVVHLLEGTWRIRMPLPPARLWARLDFCQEITWQSSTPWRTKAIIVPYLYVYLQSSTGARRSRWSCHRAPGPRRPLKACQGRRSSQEMRSWPHPACTIGGRNLEAVAGVNATALPFSARTCMGCALARELEESAGPATRHLGGACRQEPWIVLSSHRQIRHKEDWIWSWELRICQHHDRSTHPARWNTSKKEKKWEGRRKEVQMHTFFQWQCWPPPRGPATTVAGGGGYGGVFGRRQRPSRRPGRWHRRILVELNAEEPIK
jgi:hypothetical protein